VANKTKHGNVTITFNPVASKHLKPAKPKPKAPKKPDGSLMNVGNPSHIRKLLKEQTSPDLRYESTAGYTTRYPKDWVAPPGSDTHKKKHRNKGKK
jgi:hypothetical protein